MPVEESRAAVEARQYCWVTHRVGAIITASLSPQASIGSWTTERLAHQTPEAQNCRAGPTQGAPLSVWRADLRSRTPAGAPLCAWSVKKTEKDPRQGSPLSVWMGRAMEKDWSNRPSDRKLQEAEKKAQLGPQLLGRRQSVSLHASCCRGPRKPSSWATFMLSSHGAERNCHRQRETWLLCTQGRFGGAQLFVTLDSMACQSSLSGDRGKFSRQERWSVLANPGCHPLLYFLLR